jgi:hypothetical protein
MAISTKAELHTAVANWLNRSDLTSRIPEFITLAEESLNRKLRTRDMLSRSTTSTNAQYVALPSDFLEMLNVELTSTDPPRRLLYATSDRSDDYREQKSNKAGIPVHYTIEGSAIQLNPTPDASYTIQMSYYQKIPALSAVADSGDNWLLVSNSSIYLYATLVQASSYLMDPQAGSMWDGLLARAVGELESSDDKSRFAGGTLTMRPKYIYT